MIILSMIQKFSIFISKLENYVINLFEYQTYYYILVLSFI